MGGIIGKLLSVRLIRLIPLEDPAPGPDVTMAAASRVFNSQASSATLSLVLKAKAKQAIQTRNKET